MDNALDRGPDESQSPSLFTDAEEAKLSPDVPPISISQPTEGALNVVLNHRGSGMPIGAMSPIEIAYLI